MGYMDATSLCRLACVSRAVYVFAHVDELWKGLVVQVRSRQVPLSTRKLVHVQYQHRDEARYYRGGGALSRTGTS